MFQEFETGMAALCKLESLLSKIKLNFVSES